MTMTDIRQSIPVTHPIAGPWVIGHDGSDGSRRAIEWAVNHAPGRATELRLVSAWQLPVTPAIPTAGPMLMHEECEAIAGAAQRDMESTVAELTPTLDVPVKGAVAQGGAASVLIEHAADAALVVVGSRGRGGFGRLLLGSTSTQIAVHSEVPTVVVPPAGSCEAGSRILVGVDCSPNSREALGWAIEFARPGSVVQPVWVWDTSPLAVGADEFFFPDAGDVAMARFDDFVAGFAQRAESREVTIESEFVRGSPRRDLAERARAADLVVMGARGHGAVGAALLGSVSTWMLHHAQRPTVVVPS